MQDWTSYFQAAAKAEPAEHAQRGYEALASILLLSRSSWSSELQNSIKVQRMNLIELFKLEPGLAQLFRDFDAQLGKTGTGASDHLDAVTAPNFATSLSHLLWDCERHGLHEDLDIPLKAAIDGAVDDLVIAANDQITTLANMAQTIVQLSEALGLKQRRIVLVELPIGNSLPTQLVESLLTRAGFSTERVCASLSRSDAGGARARVRTLLRSKLDELPGKPDDLILYVDEWNTGTNFAKISERLQRLAAVRNPGAHVLPVALLAHGARERSGFLKLEARHHAATMRVGVLGSKVQFQFPKLPSVHALPSPFFWGERDRLAGYRKMQLWGAMFSSIDAAITSFADNAELREQARHSLFTEVAGGGMAIPDNLVENRQAFDEFYLKAYDDYVGRRATIHSLDHSSHAIGPPSIDSPIAELAAAFLKSLQGTPAYVCAALAVVYLSRTHSINPKDRYHFEDHAPVVLPLTGYAARAHDQVLKHLKERASRRL